MSVDTVRSAARVLIRRQGERRALRQAIFEIEKLGIERSEFEKVRYCLQAMIATRSDKRE